MQDGSPTRERGGSGESRYKTKNIGNNNELSAVAQQRNTKTDQPEQQRSQQVAQSNRGLTKMPGSGTRILTEIQGDEGERIVLLDWEKQPGQFCNLLKMAPDGAVLWTAKPVHPLDGIWVEINFEKGVFGGYELEWL